MMSETESKTVENNVNCIPSIPDKQYASNRVAKVSASWLKHIRKKSVERSDVVRTYGENQCSWLLRAANTSTSTPVRT